MSTHKNCQIQVRLLALLQQRGGRYHQAAGSLVQLSYWLLQPLRTHVFARLKGSGALFSERAPSALAAFQQ